MYTACGDATIDELTSLYNSVGWAPYTRLPHVMEGLLAGSRWWMTARDDENLIGLVRVISDDLSIAYVQDLLIQPDYHRRGIGTELLKAAMNRFAHVRQIVLVTDDNPQMSAFYTSVGLVPIGTEEGACFVRYGATTPPPGA